MKGLNKKIKVWESKSVDQAVEEAEVESPGSVPSLPGDAQVEADGPPAEQEGGRQGDHDEGDLSWYGMAWSVVRGQEGHYKSDLVRLWRFNAVLVELLDDQAVGDDDDDGRDEKDCDGDSPDPVGAKKSWLKHINFLVPEKYF